jgi:heterodisulfide reductase subunit A-like polyferredoxin
MSSNGKGRTSDHPLVLACECAGTLANIDFDRLERHVALHADVIRDTHWCSRVGRARMRELLEAGAKEGRRIVFAGCATDFAARRFQKLSARGFDLEVADIREGCSWVHGDDVDAVTRKAMRIVDSSVAYPSAPADTMSYPERCDTVVVIGGGVAGTQAAAELAQMGHHVELVERRPFLGGRAARIGTVFPTNDCGQCLPSTDAQAGTRKCFHRNVAIDHPDLAIRRRSTVESVTGHPGDFQVGVRTLPNIVTDACVNCGTCETVCEVESSEPGKKAIFTEFYDGRIVRTVDLETCTFCGRCAGECPVEAIDFAQSPKRVTVRAGAILTATGCEPAPRAYFDYLGYDGERVVTQVELAAMLDDWTAQASLGRMPLKELVMIQCAGSRDQRHLPHCSRLCCMIALKHAIRLKSLFPRMHITICYLEMRAAGVGYENWFLAARKAGVEFLRGTPPEVQSDAAGWPVIEVEDVTAARKRVLRPDLVVLSTGMVPAVDTDALTQTLAIDRDSDGFVEILDRKNRATETTGEGIFVCGSAAGPKALIEVNTEASAVASEIHNFLTSTGRRGTAASRVDASRCVGCDTCSTMCPFDAIRLIDRPEWEARPVAVKDEGKLAVINADSCRACGICAANCPEIAIAHNLSDDALFGRIATMTRGVDKPVVGFYCRECAGAAIGLAGQRRDKYPVGVQLIELPCLGRLSALHIVEAARLGAAAVFLAGCAEGRCQYRSGDTSAVEQLSIAEEVLAESRRPLPLELWHLCAVDRMSVGRRIRLFHARAVGDEISVELVDREMGLIGASGAACAGGGPCGRGL